MGIAVDNDKVVAVLGEKLDNVSDKIDDLCRQYHVDHDRLTVNTARITSLESLASRPSPICLAHDGVIRDVIQLRVDVAKLGVTSGMAGGGVVSAVGLGLFGLFKLLKWI